jgi:WD40 repeat protein
MLLRGHAGCLDQVHGDIFDPLSTRPHHTWQIMLTDSVLGSIHPSMMIPEHRLFELLTQVKEANINNDPYHNSKLWPSLYVDHVDSDLDDFPLRQKVKLKRHTDEVWALAFSNDGTRLATGGKDSLVVIYETETFQILHIFEGLTGAVAYLSWSPDDTKLIICGQMSYPDAGGRARVSTHAVEIWNPENATRIAVLSMFMEPVSSAAWAPDGKTFVTSSMDDQLPLVSWPADATSIKDMIHIFEGSYEGPIDFRCQDCALAGVSPPSNSVFAAPDQPIDRNNQPIRLVAISNSTFIHIFDYRTHTQLNVINMDTKMTSINLSRDGQEMLLNFAEGEVQTRDENFNVKKRFEGQKHGSFVIRSCFGAAQETVVVSGSEGSRRLSLKFGTLLTSIDGKVNIWHRHSGRLLRSLTAHPAIGGPNGTSTSCVNAVSWNTANPSMFASAGDDRMVIVWVT